MVYRRLLAGFVSVLTATTGFAIRPPEGDALRQKEFQDPQLHYGNVFRSVAELPADVSRRLALELGRLGVDAGNAYFDLRTGHWGTLIVTRPLIPGPGVGNDLRWSALGLDAPQGVDERKEAAWEAFRQYLAHHAAELRIDPSELAEPTLTAHGERLIQIHAGRQIDGIPVRGAFVKAAINSGNLVLLGQRKWGDLELETRPGISAVEAEQALRQHVEVTASHFREAPRLEILPVSSRPDETLEMLGDGQRHRLAWVLMPVYEGHSVGTWEARVDAHGGELLAFQDTNQYASRRVSGWIYPLSSDGQPPDGELQEGYPMPFADVILNGEHAGFTSTGGVAPPGIEGLGSEGMCTTLSGRFVGIQDTCGAIHECAADGELDLEGVEGTDCAVPSGHSAGDTNASRTGFYELNRLIEQARGYLPDKPWLDQQLIANMNIDTNCNAFWSGSTVNFYTSGGGCANSGEIAAVFDHEWGHGMDENDGDPTISRPGGGIADIYAQNRLNESCIGRGFVPGFNCHGYGDPCLDCTGARDVDWEKHVSGKPHDLDWALDACSGGGPDGPLCAGATHCEGQVVSEASWDLVHRDLMGFDGSDFDLDLNTALELGTRLAYYGSHNVADWYQCVTDGTGGCNADSGYLGYLAADDDNGDLTDGTPHMTAIFAAFHRHQIACDTPTVQNSGCTGGPTSAPANFGAETFDEGVELTWDPVADASEYWIFRTEGVRGCDFGKALVGKTSDTTFTETGLGNGFEVFYGVVAVGDSDACTSPMSPCLAVTPEPAPIADISPESFELEVPEGGSGGDTLSIHSIGSLDLDWSIILDEALPPICEDATEVGWLGIDPDAGTTAPGDTDLVNVTVDTTGLDAGTFEASLCVTTNDPNAGVVPVPVSLTVTAGEGGSFTPVALEVDVDAVAAVAGDGNGVFEPGERVQVAPTWRNDGDAPQSLLGIASDFTGPAGPDYTIAAADADYGEVGAGETVSCRDGEQCYELGIGPQGVERPALHWDANFEETLSDETPQTWTLHIGDSFADVARTSPFYHFIETLLHAGVTGGCSDTEYCPGATNTRGQMPVFVLRALEGPDYAPPACEEGSQVFADVPHDSGFCPWIAELFRRGVVAGCGGGNYCPGDPVTRAQMAIFLLKTREGDGYTPPECSGIFEDVDCPSAFADWVEELYDRGVTGGCNQEPLEYCPGNPNTRGQMGAFLSRTFELALYGP